MAVNTKKEKPELTYGKLPPQALDLEEAVLGAALLESECLEILFSIIQQPEVFYLDAHQRIFKAIKTLFDKGASIDLLTVTEQLRRTSELDLVGDAYGITKLTMAVMSSAHVEDHARIVVEKHLARELIKLGGEAQQLGYDGSKDVFKSMDQVELKMHQLSSAGVKKKVREVSNTIVETMKKIFALIDRNVDFTGINTGFPSLNEVTGGWQKTDLIIIGARPSVGKTAFAINTALNAAADLRHGSATAIFSLEMDVHQLNERMLSCISGIKLDHIRKPKKLTKEEILKINNASKTIAGLKLHIDDTAGLTSMELRTKARKLVSQHDVGLIIIDYLQLMECDKDRGENREQQISKISRDLKKLAKDLEVPVIALSQMSRSVDTQNREPELSDLRESGAIEQDADLVMFLYRPSEKTLEKKPELRGKVLGTIKKNRQGELRKVVFDADNTIQRWVDFEAPTNNAFKTPGQVYYVPDINPTLTDDLPF